MSGVDILLSTHAENLFGAEGEEELKGDSGAVLLSFEVGGEAVAGDFFFLLLLVLGFNAGSEFFKIMGQTRNSSTECIKYFFAFNLMGEFVLV